MQYLVEGNDLALFQFKDCGRMETGRLVAAKDLACGETVFGDAEGVDAQRQQYLAVANPVEGLLLAVGQRDGDPGACAHKTLAVGAILPPALVGKLQSAIRQEGLHELKGPSRAIVQGRTTGHGL